MKKEHTPVKCLHRSSFGIRTPQVGQKLLSFVQKAARKSKAPLTIVLKRWLKRCVMPLKTTCITVVAVISNTWLAKALYLTTANRAILIKSRWWIHTLQFKLNSSQMLKTTTHCIFSWPRHRRVIRKSSISASSTRWMSTWIMQAATCTAQRPRTPTIRWRRSRTSSTSAACHRSQTNNKLQCGRSTTGRPDLSHSCSAVLPTWSQLVGTMWRLPSSKCSVVMAVDRLTRMLPLIWETWTSWIILARIVQ